MEKKIINSFGSIVIPAHIRKELGIDGNMLLCVSVRESVTGDKEIVVRKPIDAEYIFNTYKTWAEVISRVAESSVALVWNNQVLSMSSESMTESYLGKGLRVNPILSTNFKKFCNGGVIVNNPDDINFLQNGNGKVSAYYKIKSIEEDSCFFVIVKGTKYDKKMTKAEEGRRYQIINDIVAKL